MQYGRFAEIYDELMFDAGYDRWAGYVAGFIPKGASVLECACGTGEISVRLAKMGYKLLASDISEEMLMEAGEKQRKLGLSLAALRFVRMDMRALESPKRVDCVLACCDGVNYLTSREDVKAFFDSARNVLKPDGVLLFDVSSRYKLSEVIGCKSFVENGEQLAYMWSNAYDPESKLIEMELSFFVKKGELYERFDERHIQRAHSERELGSWLKEAGFEYEAYGFLTREPSKPNDERIVFYARKK